MLAAHPLVLQRRDARSPVTRRGLRALERGWPFLAGLFAGFALLWRRVKTPALLPAPKHAEVPILAENRGNTVFAWRGPAMLVVDPRGSTSDVASTGFFFRQTRYLRDLRLELFGEAPHACSLAEISPHELEAAYVYPERRGGGSDQEGKHKGLRYEDLDLRLRYEVQPNGLDAELRIVNRWLESATVELGWALSADFADVDEVSSERRQTAPVLTTPTANGVTFRYLHPRLPLQTEVTVDGPGAWRYQDGRLVARVELQRQRETRIALHVRAVDLEDPISDRGADARVRRLEALLDGFTRVEAPGPAPIATMTNASLRDLGSLALLEGREDEWLVPAAGIPLFQSLWPRDALTTAWQATMFDRGVLAENILCAVGRLQGTRDDPWRDEQPGRTPRGVQRGPLARLGVTPMGRYYGDYAGPFAFLFTLAQLYAWSGDEALVRQHFDEARRILDWARERGDLDGDGYLEYQTLSPLGPKHQGWRDAENAVVYADGRQVDTPIATCEVQGYWFAAQQIMAVFCAVLGELRDAAAHLAHARELKRRFNRDFWMPAERCVALGLDADKRQIDAVASNCGQALTTGIVDDEHLRPLVQRLFEPDMFSGWGIRTLSTRNPAYNPLSYHLGTVWPVENATFLFGLRRYGFEAEAHRLARALYELQLMWRGHRVPECIGGYDRGEARHPGAYPQANAPQAWNQSVLPILVQTMLGARPLAPLKVLAVYPALPDWVPELTVRHLKVGDATVSLRFQRKRDGGSRFDVLEKRGALHIVDQPPIESLTAGIWDRLGALLESRL